MDRSLPLIVPATVPAAFPAGSSTTPSRSRLGLSRRDIIAAHWLPNGDLRFFRQDAKMGGYLSLYVIISAILLPPSLRLTSIM
jgi:hypothetical protein